MLSSYVHVTYKYNNKKRLVVDLYCLNSQRSSVNNPSILSPINNWAAREIGFNYENNN